MTTPVGFASPSRRALMLLAAATALLAGRAHALEGLYSWESKTYKGEIYPFGFVTQIPDAYRWHGLATSYEFKENPTLSVKYGLAYFSMTSLGLFAGPKWGTKDGRYQGVELAGTMTLFCVPMEMSTVINGSDVPAYHFKVGLGFLVPLLFLQKGKLKTIFIPEKPDAPRPEPFGSDRD